MEFGSQTYRAPVCMRPSQAVSIADSLIHVSVGIKDVGDLMGDSDQALRRGLDRGGKA